MRPERLVRMEEADRALRERRVLVNRLAQALADPECVCCGGDGIDYGDDEWTVCDCVEARVKALSQLPDRAPEVSP